jgi:hypothetical protein
MNPLPSCCAFPALFLRCEWPVFSVATDGSRKRETLMETLMPTTADLSGQSELIYRPVATKAMQLRPAQRPRPLFWLANTQQQSVKVLKSLTGLSLDAFCYCISEALTLISVAGLSQRAGDGRRGVRAWVQPISEEHVAACINWTDILTQNALSCFVLSLLARSPLLCGPAVVFCDCRSWHSLHERSLARRSAFQPLEMLQLSV